MSKFVSKLALVAFSAAFSTAAIASPPHFSPASTSVTGDGIGNVAGVICAVTVTGVTGPDVGPAEGSAHSNHADYAHVTLTNSGSPECDGKTINATIAPNGDFAIDGQTGLSACMATLPVFGTATLVNSSPTQVTATVPTVMFGYCPLSAVLNVSSVQVVN